MPSYAGVTNKVVFPPPQSPCVGVVLNAEVDEALRRHPPSHLSVMWERLPLLWAYLPQPLFLLLTLYMSADENKPLLYLMIIDI